MERDGETAGEIFTECKRHPENEQHDEAGPNSVDNARPSQVRIPRYGDRNGPVAGCFAPNPMSQGRWRACRSVGCRLPRLQRLKSRIG